MTDDNDETMTDAAPRDPLGDAFDRVGILNPKARDRLRGILSPTLAAFDMAWNDNPEKPKFIFTFSGNTDKVLGLQHFEISIRHIETHDQVKLFEILMPLVQTIGEDEFKRMVDPDSSYDSGGPS